MLTSSPCEGFVSAKCLISNWVMSLSQRGEGISSGFFQAEGIINLSRAAWSFLCRFLAITGRNDRPTVLP